MTKNEARWMKNFFRAVLSLENEKECRQFFEDICTIKELQDLTHRLEVARLLSEGRVFNDIRALTGTSSATISRVNKCLQYGRGGYKTVLKRLAEEDSGSENKGAEAGAADRGEDRK